MRIDGSWVPESDEELELFEKLQQAKVEAFESGVQPDQIAAAMSFMASTSLVRKPDDNKQTLEEKIEEEKQKVDKCPDCNKEIRAVIPLGIGGQLMVQPCGHEFEWGERDKLNGWVEDPVDKNE